VEDFSEIADPTIKSDDPESKNKEFVERERKRMQY
jgi:hypothetical protein